jgi:hypothetical protein
MKECFDCKRKYPLFMFATNHRKYQRPEHKGKNLVCTWCTYKRWKKDMNAWILNLENEKFEKIEFKSKWEIIKRLLSNRIK